MTLIPPAFRALVPVTAIAVPALMLLVLGLQSVQRQQDAIGQLRAANLQLSADRVARVLADRVAAATANSLRDPAWADGWSSASSAGPHPSVVRSIINRHRVVGDLLLVDGTSVMFPPLAAPFEADDVEMVESCGANLRHGERLEFGGLPARALVLYRACLPRTTSSVQRARLLARIARAQRRAGDESGAIDTWRSLEATHADENDRFGRPYGLLAAIELHDLAAPEASPVLRMAGDALLAGRWVVGDEQARYFREEVRARLGATWAGDEGPYFERLARARALERRLPLSDEGPSASLRMDEVVLDGRRTRVYHGPVPGRTTGRAVVVPSRGWVEGTLLPAVARDLGIVGTPRIVDTAPPREDGALASADGALAPWRVWVPAPPQAISRLPLVLQGTLTLLVSSVLGLGILFMVRDARRERAVALVRSQFVSAASHELRTPLAMILLYAQTLLEDVDADREERRGSYAIIAEESERLRHLLDKVLDVSRIDAGRRHYRLELGPLRASVEAALGLIGPQLRRRGFVIDLDLSDVPDVYHDREAMTGALINLVENAAKYSGTARCIGVRLYSSEDEVVAEVWDQGIGIPADEVPRLGEQFFRSRLATSIGGHGLGLYLVRHAMSEHGGRLEVSSTPGHGSTFRLVLPRTTHPPGKGNG